MRIGGFKAEITLPLEARKTWRSRCTNYIYHHKKAMEYSKAANKSLAKQRGSTSVRIQQAHFQRKH
jgi:hypothetical protein